MMTPQYALIIESWWAIESGIAAKGGFIYRTNIK
jgi:hypothetical protein